MKQGLLPWGRHPLLPQRPHAVHWRDDIPVALRAAARPTLAFGNGRAYGDSCLAASGEVIFMRGADRVIHIDWTNGTLHAEAGMTLGEILELTVPHGWFLPVVPGTSAVTLGGAIANDVHGKNHHRRGTFGCHVRALQLIRSDSPPQLCSRDENTSLFNATIGGLGLTGIIAAAEVQLVPVSSPAVNTLTRRFDRLEDFFSLSERFDSAHEYGVAWIDCMATGRQRGRGIYIAADHAPAGTTARAGRPGLKVPFTPPLPVINSLTTRAFNPVYWRMSPPRETAATMHYKPYFQPLDGIGDWNRLYGPRGFQQFQCVLPDATAEQGVADILDAVTRSRAASFLTVLKRCGDIPSPGLLSFPMKGTTLAIDFPNTPRLEQDLLHRLDAITHRAGGRLYPAKDAHMSAWHFRTAYPRWPELEAMRDPALKSRFWERVAS